MIYKFDVKGMTCAACSARVETVVSKVIGVESVEVNLLSGTMVVTSNEDLSTAIIKAVSNAGYAATVHGGKVQKETVADDLRVDRNRIIISGAFLAVLMYFTMGHMIGLPVPRWYHAAENALMAALLQLFLTIPVVAMNRIYYIRGLRSLINRAPNMDTLIAVGSGASLVYGVFALFRMAYALGHGNYSVVAYYSRNLYFESAAMILTLISFGKYLEAKAKGRTGDAIRKLMDLSPKTAVVRRDEDEITVPVEDLKPGDIVIVRSGGSIPVDGFIVAGRGVINQSALTGESVPVEKTLQDDVAAATILSEGYLEIQTQKVGEDTTISQIVRLVEQAGGSKAPVARLADKIAGIFVPTVMGIALFTFCVWMLLGETFEFALTTAIAVLVISCPCALGLATPVAVMVGTGRGAEMGTLFKNAQSLENLHRIDTVVLDKTGTLTCGIPSVTDVLPNVISSEELLKLAASIEVKSEHPFAKAIVSAANSIDLYDAENFQSLPGQGVCATISGKVYYGGNATLMSKCNLQVPSYPELTKEGKTPLYFACDDGRYLGAIVAADVLKDDSAEAVSQMHSMKLNIVMLTGDNYMTANAIARNVGIDRVFSDVLPGDKAQIITQLQKEGHRVLMVGDGINDAPALASADVGMAIGNGTDIAMESADVVLMHSSLRGICNAISLSRATMRNIRQNLFWAFFYNSLGIPVAAGVLYPAFHILLSPMLGAAAMSMSSFFVVSNALRLRYFKVKETNTNTILKNDSKQEELTMEIVINVEGMMCPHCKARVESVCKEVAGVQNAVVDLQQKQVTVTGNASTELLRKAITDAGYEVIG